MRLVLPFWITMAMIAVLTVALVATGIAHRVPSTLDAAMEAYATAGGDLADLCGDAGDSDAGLHPDCPACHIAGAMLLPEPSPSAQAANLLFVAEVVAPRESRALRHVDDPARAPRAPPLA